MKLNKKLNTKSMCLCSMFAVLIAVGAFIKIPISIVPITLQTLFVVLAAIVLGKRLATISVGLYLFVGLIGLPVFANGGGIAYVLQPSFGYLIGFLVAAWVVGALVERRNKLWQLIIASVIGMVIIYLIGILYFMMIQDLYYGLSFTVDWLFYYLFIVYLPGDSIACVLASIVGLRLKKINTLNNIN